MTPIVSHARQRALLTAGGLVFAVGNLIHPWEHSTAAEQTATWVPAHLLLFASVFLLAAGLPVLRPALAEAGRVGTIGVVGFWAGTLAILPNTIYEAFIAPLVDGPLEVQLQQALLPTDGLAIPLFLGGGVFLGIAALRVGLPRWFGFTWIGVALALLVGPALVQPEGYIIIPATALQGLTVAALAWRHVRVPAGTAAGPSEPELVASLA